MLIKHLINQNYKNVFYSLKNNKIALRKEGHLPFNSRKITDFFLPFFNVKIQQRAYSQSSKALLSKKSFSTTLPHSFQNLSPTTSNQKIPLGIQTIEEVLKKNYVYVDKTQFAKQLIEGGKYYFINRPRRFGKSLFISMLKSVLIGDKELFKRQSIYQSDYKWDKRSVIHLDFSLMSTRTGVGFEKDLEQKIVDIAEKNKIILSSYSVESKFSQLIEELFHKHQKKVAVLMDEYDKPLTDNLDEEKVLNDNHRLMKSFLGVLKGSDPYLDFVFITGVTKFAHVSLFSGANNLNDITTHPSYAGMMGYREEEIFEFLAPLIKSSIQLKTNQLDPVTNQQLFSKMDELKSWYNGYRFSKEDVKVYNPHSILSYLKRGEFQNYWMQSGTPAFLIKQFMERPDPKIVFGGAKIDEDDLLGHFDIKTMSLPALMWQTGYFTIQNYDPVSRFYTLDYPNYEVKDSFTKTLWPHITSANSSEMSYLGVKCRKNLDKIDFQAFCDNINTAFAGVSYQIHKKSIDEGFFHMSLSLLLTGMNISHRVEEGTNKGRIDLVIEMDKHIYVIEIKKDKTAQAALEQILNKKYIEKFKTGPQGKDIIALGINFDSKTKSISDGKGILFSPEGQQKGELSYNPRQK